MWIWRRIEGNKELTNISNQTFEKSTRIEVDFQKHKEEKKKLDRTHNGMRILIDTVLRRNNGGKKKKRDMQFNGLFLSKKEWCDMKRYKTGTGSRQEIVEENLSVAGENTNDGDVPVDLTC